MWWLALFPCTALRVLITSQNTTLDKVDAAALKDSLVTQGVSDVVFLHEIPGKNPAWSHISMLARLDPKWTLVVPPNTVVDVEEVRRFVGGSVDFIGEALTDEDWLIIHHFDNKVTYPLEKAGYLVSPKVIEELSSRVTKVTKLEFIIDPIFELAKYLKNECNIVLSGIPHWFGKVVKTKTAPARRKPRANHKFLVAVKTTKKYHENRVRDVLGKTWAQDNRLDIVYMTDAVDAELKNSVDLGINTESGHCGKMVAIFKHLRANYRDRDLILISDDDTLYNVDELLRFAETLDPSLPLYVGERYAYASPDLERGYTYITTGGGLIVSQETLRLFEECDHCSCSKSDTPDDMSLGMWFRSLGIIALHSSKFHQRRPQDYHPRVLEDERPISFHNILVNADPMDIHRLLNNSNDDEDEDDEL